MNISIIIGWILSFGMVIFGIMNGGDIGQFIDINSVFITIGGTIGVLIASFPLSMLKSIPTLLKISILPRKYNHKKTIDDIVEYAKIARSKGLISLENSANEASDPFLKSSLLLIIDANDTDKVRSMLDDAIDFMSDRHDTNRGFFDKGVAVFPAFGMLGTLIGLVQMLATMDSDPDSLGANMAVALITTFYGSLFANVLFAPISSALKSAHEEEVLNMRIVEEGVLSIASGMNPRYIQEKLEFMLPKKALKQKSNPNKE